MNQGSNPPTLPSIQALTVDYSRPAPPQGQHPPPPPPSQHQQPPPQHPHPYPYAYHASPAGSVPVNVPVHPQQQPPIALSHGHASSASPAGPVKQSPTGLAHPPPHPAQHHHTYPQHPQSHHRHNSIPNQQMQISPVAGGLPIMAPPQQGAAIALQQQQQQPPPPPPPSVPPLVAMMQQSIGQGMPVNRRTFRQRRKDPSCDACRERKVKCDATESSACSECLGRQLKCQFTKDTNRRMSSIRQIRDLEKSLSKALSCMTEYKNCLKESNVSIPDSLAAQDHELSHIVLDDAPHINGEDYIGGIAKEESRQNSVTSPTGLASASITEPIKRRRPSIKTDHDYSSYHEFLNTHNNQVFKPPRYARKLPLDKISNQRTRPAPVLPPRSVADGLVQCFQQAYQTWLPIIEWSEFQKQYDRIYANKDDYDETWVPVLFAVLALGVRDEMFGDLTISKEGNEYIDTAKQYVNTSPSDDEYSLNFVLAATLISMFLAESNRPSASTLWLTTAAHVAGELGLQEMEGKYPTRLLWGMFAWDRVNSIQRTTNFVVGGIKAGELNTPSIDSAAKDDNYQYEFVGPVVHITRLLDLFGTTLRESPTPTLSWASLDLLHSHVESFASLLPSYITLSEETLQPAALMPIVLLHFARNMIQRVNLSPAAHPNLRGSSLEVSASIATETVNVMERFITACTTRSNGAKDPFAWQRMLGVQSTSLITNHLFHCSLILLSKEDYDHACFVISCLEAISKHRHDAKRYCRFIHGFAELLCTKYQTTRNPQAQSVTVPNNLRKHFAPWMDADVLAILSSDLQSVERHAWVWGHDQFETWGTTTESTDDASWSELVASTQVLRHVRSATEKKVAQQVQQAAALLNNTAPSVPKHAASKSPSSPPLKRMRSDAGEERVVSKSQTPPSSRSPESSDGRSPLTKSPNLSRASTNDEHSSSKMSIANIM